MKNNTPDAEQSLPWISMGPIYASALNFVNNNKAFIGLVVLVVFSSLISPHFLTVNNITNVLRQASVNGLLALGMTLVIISQGIDLSVGATLGLITIIAALNSSANPLYIVSASLFGGLVCGLANGILVSYVGLVSFLATLAVGFATRGITLLLADGRTIVCTFPAFIDFLGIGYVGFIPMPVIFLILVYAAFYFLMNVTRFGRIVYAIGGNEEASRLCGINIRLHRLIIFMLSGLLAAGAGLIYVSRLSTGDPSAGLGYELSIIACVAIGGTSFNGGYGGVGLTFIGTLIIGIMDNILNLMNISPFVQMIVRGVIIIVAVRASITTLRQSRMPRADGKRGEFAK
jgi:ribose transport system permease protein